MIDNDKIGKIKKISTINGEIAQLDDYKKIKETYSELSEIARQRETSTVTLVEQKTKEEMENYSKNLFNLHIAELNEHVKKIKEDLEKFTESLKKSLNAKISLFIGIFASFCVIFAIILTYCLNRIDKLYDKSIDNEKSIINILNNNEKQFQKNDEKYQKILDEISSIKNKK